MDDNKFVGRNWVNMSDLIFPRAYASTAFIDDKVTSIYH